MVACLHTLHSNPRITTAMCIPKIPSSDARLHKSLNISMSLRPIQRNETPKESPRWALRDRIGTTLWRLKPLHHNCNMHPKISAHLVERHTDPLISQQDMAWSGRMQCQKKALIGLYKDVSSWRPCHSNLGIITAIWTQKISPATIVPWGVRFWQMGCHIKALDSLCEKVPARHPCPWHSWRYSMITDSKAGESQCSQLLTEISHHYLRNSKLCGKSPPFTDTRRQFVAPLPVNLSNFERSIVPCDRICVTVARFTICHESGSWPHPLSIRRRFRFRRLLQ